ncbi:MAG: hypothetical protein KJ645_12955, partial [Planctomycetes bacterium]|nr:hypothetical protein [Planctomycetota bacterium]
KTLKEWNNNPALDLGRLYADAGLPMPPGSPEKEDLDKILFRLTPHWENLIHRVRTLAEQRSNPALFQMKVNQTAFFRSNSNQGAEPLQITLKCPDNRSRWIALFWIDEDGLCQVNPSAPLPDPIEGSKTWAFPLECPNGEVLLIGLVSGDQQALDFSGQDTAFADDMILKDKITSLSDPNEVDRLDRLIRCIKEQAAPSDGFAAAMAQCVVSP